MKRIALALALALPATAALASGSNPISEEVQTQIRTLLTEQGYDVRRIQMEDGLYEAYALRDGDRFEIYLNADMTIERIAQDD